MSRPPLPPFTAETAAQKARMAEDAWNSRDPARVALAYTVDSRWRNRSEFIQGRAAIEAFLTRQVAARARLPADQGSVGLPGEPHRRAFRIRMARRQRSLVSQLRQRELGVRRGWPDGACGIASINDLVIAESDRKYRWPLGPRPPEHPSLSELGL